MTDSFSKGAAVLHAIAITIALALISGHYNFAQVEQGNKLPFFLVQTSTPTNSP